MTDIFKTLRAAADPDKALQMSAYMRNQFDYLGIPTPIRRKLSSDYLKGIDKRYVDWDFVFVCWQQAEREFQYLACEYLRKLLPMLTPNDIPDLRKLATTKSWWDTIDSLDTIIGDIALRYPQVNKTLLAWSIDTNFWLRRIAIDHQLSRRDKTDIALLTTIITNNFGQKEFFINKAIGWALREYSKTNPAWVRDFIARNRDKMAKLSIREASKYV